MDPDSVLARLTTSSRTIAAFRVPKVKATVHPHVQDWHFQGLPIKLLGCIPLTMINGDLRLVKAKRTARLREYIDTHVNLYRNIPRCTDFVELLYVLLMGQVTDEDLINEIEFINVSGKTLLIDIFGQITAYSREATLGVTIPPLTPYEMRVVRNSCELLLQFNEDNTGVVCTHGLVKFAGLRPVVQFDGEEWLVSGIAGAGLVIGDLINQVVEHMMVSGDQEHLRRTYNLERIDEYMIVSDPAEKMHTLVRAGSGTVILPFLPTIAFAASGAVLVKTADYFEDLVEDGIDRTV